MKKLLATLFLIPISLFAQVQTATYTYSPSPTFEGTQALTITVNGSSINEGTWGVANNQLYAWVWALDAASAAIPHNANGTWDNSDASKLMSYNAVSDTYSFTYSTSVFNFFNSTNVAKVGFLIKAKNGNNDKKSQDILLNVGSFQVTLLNSIVAGGTQFATSSYAIAARHTGGNADYVLKRNGTTINTQNNLAASTGSPSYSFNDTSLADVNNYSLEVTQNGVTKTSSFIVLKTITPTSSAIPSGLVDGINYNPTDATKATLVLSAPFKDFVYVAGSFNNYQPTTAYAMKKDPSSSKFWLELTGLSANQIYTFQYWVCDQTSLPATSPALVKTADPFSKLVLSPFDDAEIASLGVFPNLPAYPVGQEREVTVLQTGSNSLWNYTWSSATTNFVKPKKKDLVIYELLVRDFDTNRTYQNLIDKIDYFKNLKINAIQLMPVMEFEGNESWGYNTSYHMALDKRYGPPAKLKEFIDLCHQNGIAVILDIALNHVFGRSPLARMWMNDTNNDGWDNGTSAENPYINQNPTHTYNVGSDLNHFRTPENLTNNYVTETIKTWMIDYKVDGFRWDLTKGFTNQCGATDFNCTEQYRTDRVAKLKAYTDIQWAIDPNFYVIFEHLGTSAGSYQEEVEWANYQRSGDTKGIMLWRKMTNDYVNLLKGNFADVTAVAESSDRFIGYAESHDEERIAYKALVESGQTNGNLDMIHKRLSALGAMHLLVPGPKMIWHFGELGYEKSLWTCNNNTVSFSSPDCKLDTKPQPQWTNNWLTNTNRSTIYNDWAKMINLKKSENLFENGTYEWNISQTGRPQMKIYTSTSPTANLSYAIVIANFSTATYNVNVTFPYTGNWVNLMDNSIINVPTLVTQVSIEPGGFKVIGNQAPTMNNNQNEIQNITVYPNPSQKYFNINLPTKQVQIISLAGQLIKTFEPKNENDNYPISDLQNGIYIVKITDNNNNTSTQKLIKN